MTTQIHDRSSFLSSQRAAASHDGEASGLIDVRAIGGAHAGKEVRAEVPHFGGLTLPPVLLTPTRPVTASVAAVQRSQTPLFALLGVLTLGVVGLAGFVVTRPPPQQAQSIVRVLGPTALASAERSEEKRPVAEVVAEEEVVAEVAAVVEEKGGKDRKVVRKPAKVGEASKVEVAKAAVVDAPKPESKPADYGVDCILGKASCSDKPAKVEVVKVAAVPTDLPERLEQADISAGTSAARAAAASRCARLAKGGEKVQVKLSIAGPSGAVVGASATEDAGNPQLAACCVAELQQASFRKVAKQQMGTVVTVKF